MSLEKPNINGLYFTKDPFNTQYLKQKAQPNILAVPFASK
jgi:hypothetical protein